MDFTIKEGNYEKLGAVISEKAVIFTFTAEQKEECALLLYEKKDGTVMRIEVPATYCIGSLRSICIQGLDWKKYDYNYEIDKKVVVDPYARKIIGREEWNTADVSIEKVQVKGGIVASDFTWDEEKRPTITKDQMVMYKLHVRGFSMDAASRGKEKGTFAAIIKKIPYLKKLGITTLEVMPIYEFEELEPKEEVIYPAYLEWTEKKTDLIRKQTIAADRKVNYWGYTKGNYFAVKESYGKKDARHEWKELIDTLHANQMELVMELHFMEQENHNLILEALRYWVREFHVDGFHLLGNKLPITAIIQDALLSRTKIFYDGFDATMLENGKTDSRLFVYNDQYLYPARKMLNHAGGSMLEFAGQQRKQDQNQGFVNYFSNNNGFTMADVFSYERKHNEANGEENKDGNDWNFSNNCGAEGYTRKKYITELRERQYRNAFACVLLAQGVPLIWSGDEIANSQQGNNNAYCQDNAIGWVNWKNEKRYGWLRDYVTKLITFRKEHPVLSLAMPMKLCDYKQKGTPDLSYHAENAWILDFLPDQQAVGMLYCGAYASTKKSKKEPDIYVAYNFRMGSSSLALPQLTGTRKWKLVMDTSLGQQPFLEENTTLPEQQRYRIKGQSVAILIGE